ncbi:MAG: hypothetical protein NWE83_05485 [Candidatus Bathyarchaeota archaeon]|nr:hypothetical protein [Candidatus Bathyarchaeota archaeon]
MTQNSKRELARIKIEIVQKAGSGALDRNPVLAFQNDHSCQTCHAIMNVRFLDYLIAGDFTFGKSETIETVYAAPTLIGLHREYEQSTPIIIKIPCQTCGIENSFSPISLEYLLHILQQAHNFAFYA